jgi:hypothetical protein
MIEIVDSRRCAVGMDLLLSVIARGFRGVYPKPSMYEKPRLSVIFPDSRVRIRLKCGHCSRGAPFSDFSIFAPYMFFFTFKKIIWILQP